MAIRGRVPAAAALMLLGSSGPAAALEPTVLMPTGPWNVEYAPDSCVLARAFGRPDEPVYFRIEQFEPGVQVNITLVGSPFKSRRVAEPLRIAFGEEVGLVPITTTALFGKSKNNRSALSFQISLREAVGGAPHIFNELTASEVSALVDLRVSSADGKTQVVFKTGDMAQAFAAVQVCIDQLLRAWGADPEQQRNLSRRAEPLNQGAWIRPEDYPRGAIDSGRSGNVHFRLTVDKGGRVSKCSVQSATDRDVFARRTCQLLSRRAQFQPALDATGKPVSSYYVNSVQWILGKSRAQGVRMSEENFDDLSM